MVPTTPETAPYLLDLTRLISRAGRPLTGVDRVEFAYLEHLSKAGPLYGLVRTRLGFVLLGPSGCDTIRTKLADGGWGPPDLLARVSRKADPMRLRAEADVRRVAEARCLQQGLGRMLRARFAHGVRYLNTGHSNLGERVVTAVRQLPSSKIAVLIHDTIPLDVPHFQRPGTPLRFKRFLERAGRAADLIICNSHQTEADLHRHLPQVPKTVVAHLGVPPPKPGLAPEGPWTDAPYFITIGTIEPRKNHALLLDIWPGVTGAHLVICGQRGWNNEAVFRKLDQHPERIHELPNLSDDALFGLLARSAGLLFPSFAEGYGLPPIEAAALGVPVLCNDLPIYREVLGDIPVYVDVSDGYLWQTGINERIREYSTGTRAAATDFAPPTWEAHFKTVLRMF